LTLDKYDCSPNHMFEREPCKKKKQRNRVRSCNLQMMHCYDIKEHGKTVNGVHRGRCQFNQHNCDRQLGRLTAIANLTVTRYNMPVIKF